MKYVLGLIGVLFVILISVLTYYGMFAKVTISEQETGPYWLVYEKYIGDYKNVGPVMTKLSEELKKKESIETSRGFGLYYDNPQEVAKDKLRSLVGCILEEKDTSKIQGLQAKYNIKSYPVSKSVVASFPYRGHPSIFVGIFKVYPKFFSYLKDHNFTPVPLMELYDLPNKKIIYIGSVNLPKPFFDSLLETRQ
ncbi:MAG: GyrI-like domain-containing protein [bacterium]|nr:GyrI-like domain-containing protein [bacterium]